MSKLEQAIQLATRLHNGQVDKAGERYIEHPLRVMNAVDGETEKIVAVLHDTVEDTGVTITELEDLFGSLVAAAVEALTRLAGEDYFDFVRRVKQNPIAAKVKVADIKDNMNLTRLKTISDQDLRRNEKYKEALSILQLSE
ncbi:MAG TPA: HD domain-containing protein [Trichocoleus sp.]